MDLTGNRASFEDWFTVESVNGNTFVISEYGHWEQTHAYLFVGRQRAVLVDAGTGAGNISAVVKKITRLPLGVVLTHCHWDHIGGCKYFEHIAIHKEDSGWLEEGLPISVEQVRNSFLKYPTTKSLPDGFDINSYYPFIGKASHILEDLERIDLGGRTLTVLHTPGHSPGHVSVYEEQTGYLATGDLLYEGTLDAFYESTSPEQFAASLERLAELEGVKKLLPGHFRLDIPVGYLKEACAAFAKIKSEGKLKQGTGIHRFEHIAIHL
ncbi:MAG: MBL fold metallo-hydrolase [bacterium]|nr:MBL fold metallo-hydrolase [bacterium]MDZ4296456.1 MBL fold metallo-hydrolase [Patescibacteria group bacterium]